ncbi:MAG: hypothetical protein WAU47_11095, partial [Desulfobaccales bacterium]
MSYQDTNNSYIQPDYTTLQLVNNEISANFSGKLQIFLSQNPEFSNTKSHLVFLLYCYDHYINCDPISRDLPLQEKLKQAGEMAKNFMGI